MDNLVDIDEYKSPKILIPKKIYSFTIILVFIFITLFLLLFFKYDYYYKGVGIINDENILELKASYSDSYKVIKNNKIIINKNKFSYKIKNISVPIVENNLIYQDIIIDINQINIPLNTVIEFKIKYNNKSGFEIIKELIFGKEN